MITNTKKDMLKKIIYSVTNVACISIYTGRYMAMPTIDEAINDLLQHTALLRHLQVVPVQLTSNEVNQVLHG